MTFQVGLLGLNAFLVILWIAVLMRPKREHQVEGYRLIAIDEVQGENKYEKPVNIVLVRHVSKEGKPRDSTWLSGPPGSSYYVCEETGEQASTDLRDVLNGFVHADKVRRAQAKQMDEELEKKAKLRAEEEYTANVRRRAITVIELLKACPEEDWQTRAEIRRAAGLHYTPEFTLENTALAMREQRRKDDEYKREIAKALELQAQERVEDEELRRKERVS